MECVEGGPGYQGGLVGDPQVADGVECVCKNDPLDSVVSREYLFILFSTLR